MFLVHSATHWIFWVGVLAPLVKSGGWGTNIFWDYLESSIWQMYQNCHPLVIIALKLCWNIIFLVYLSLYWIVCVVPWPPWWRVGNRGQIYSETTIKLCCKIMFFGRSGYVLDFGVGLRFPKLTSGEREANILWDCLESSTCWIYPDYHLLVVMVVKLYWKIIFLAYTSVYRNLRPGPGPHDKAWGWSGTIVSVVFAQHYPYYSLPVAVRLTRGGPCFL